MAKMLTRYGFEGRNVTVRFEPRSYEGYLWNLVRIATRDRDIRVVEAGEFDAERREIGKDWPADAETMIGMKRLRNVRECLESVIADGVPGDFIETGAWRGGTCIFARAIFKAYGVTDRKVWVADSFEGLPPPTAASRPTPATSTTPRSSSPSRSRRCRTTSAATTCSTTRSSSSSAGSTRPSRRPRSSRSAVLRLDGDMYASTIDALEPLYDKVAVGGYVIVDDYGAVKGCAQAIHDFREARGITDEMHQVDWAGVYWRKS